MDKKHRGAHSELVATAWLLSQGYEVFRNVSPHGIADVIAVNFAAGEHLWIDVKTSNHIAAPDGSIMERCDSSRLTGEQQHCGVRRLIVTRDGNCHWVEEKPVKGPKPQCKAPGCTELSKAAGLSTAHYSRMESRAPETRPRARRRCPLTTRTEVFRTPGLHSLPANASARVLAPATPRIDRVTRFPLGSIPRNHRNRFCLDRPCTDLPGSSPST